MSVEVRSTPASRCLEWLLQGLDARPGWGADVEAVLAPAFLAAVPATLFLDTYRRRNEQFAPVSVRLVQADDHAARADVVDPAGQVSVVHCQVEHSEPFRITRTWMEPFVPTGLGPRLPLDFTGRELPHRAAGAQLVVLSGVPGSGKSTVAESVGRDLGAPVFSSDWLLGALTPFGGRHLDHPVEVAAELLTTLAFQQLAAGQSAVLDSPAEASARGGGGSASPRRRELGCARSSACAPIVSCTAHGWRIGDVTSRAGTTRRTGRTSCTDSRSSLPGRPMRSPWTPAGLWLRACVTCWTSYEPEPSISFLRRLPSLLVCVEAILA